MKNKNIWFVIVGIVAVGILVTICNGLFLKKKETIPEATVYESVLAGSVAASSVDEVLKPSEDGGQAVVGGGASEETPQETEIISPVISPLETAEASLEVMPQLKENPVEEFIEEGAISYRTRLDELDLQIQRIRSEETESTTYSMKTAADNELKLWDSELNNIYNDILTHLDEEETKQLVAEEREWMKIRDDRAVEAAKKSAGGTLEGLEYTASLAESTRQRAYELADRYEEFAQ